METEFNWYLNDKNKYILGFKAQKQMRCLYWLVEGCSYDTANTGSECGWSKEKFLGFTPNSPQLCEALRDWSPALHEGLHQPSLKAPEPSTRSREHSKSCRSIFAPEHQELRPQGWAMHIASARHSSAALPCTMDWPCSRHLGRVTRGQPRHCCCSSLSSQK